MTHAKKLLSLLLVLALVLSFTPMAFAAEGDEPAEVPAVETAEEVPAEETAEEAAEAQAPVEEEAAEPVELAEDAEDEAEPVEADLDAAPLLGDVAMTGSCGESLNWTLTETGTEPGIDSEGNPILYHNYSLVITGSGAMTDYTRLEEAPWTPYTPWYESLSTLSDADVSGQHRVTSLTLPDGLTHVGDEAFTLLPIGSVTWPSALTSIGKRGFDSCGLSGDLVVPASITSLGDQAFYQNYITSVSLPAGLLSIGRSCFGKCSRLRTVTFGSVGDTSYDVDFTTAPAALAFDYGVFRETAITSAKLPADLSNYGMSLFADSALARVHLDPGTTALTVQLFRNASLLEDINLGDCVGLTTLPIRAFEGCTSLNTIDLRNITTSINYTAFAGAVVKTLYLPADLSLVNTSGAGALGGLAQVTDALVLHPDTTSIPNTLFSKYYVSTVDGVQTATGSAVQLPETLDLSGLTKLSSIGGGSFRGCAGLKYLTLPDLEEGTLTISGGAFTYCPDLRTVSMPCATIFEGAVFSSCPQLGAADVGEEPYILDFSNLRPRVSEGTVPGNMLTNCPSLTRIKLPANVSYGYGALTGCGITEIVFTEDPENDVYLTTLNVQMYAFLPDLKRVDLSGYSHLTTVGEQAFKNCPNLTAVILPDSVTSIGNGAYQGCTSLSYIRLPASLSTIGYNCFMDSTGIASLDATAIRDASALTTVSSVVPSTNPIFYVRSEDVATALRAPAGAIIAVTGEDMTFSSFTAGALSTPTISASGKVFGGWYTGENGSGTEYAGTLSGGQVWYAYIIDKSQVVSPLQTWFNEQIAAKVATGGTVLLTDYTDASSVAAGGALALLNTGSNLITVDLAGKTVTADGLAVFGNVAIIDSVGGGKLAVPQNCIYLTATNGSTTGSGYLPVWDNGNSVYIFCNTSLIANANPSNTASGGAQYAAQLGYTGGTALKTLLTGSASPNTGVTVVFRMTWTTDKGDVSQEFAFNNDQLQIGAASSSANAAASKQFVLNINGANKLSTVEADKNLRVTPILRFSGSCITEIRGTESTLDLTT